MRWRLLHWTTYEEGALPLGASHIRATVQSVTPVTRRFFGAAADCWASAAFELPRGTTPNRMATMHIASNASFPILTFGLFIVIPIQQTRWRPTAGIRDLRHDHSGRRQGKLAATFEIVNRPVETGTKMRTCFTVGVTAYVCRRVEIRSSRRCGCRLIWKMLHQRIRYEERGPEPSAPRRRKCERARWYA